MTLGVSGSQLPIIFRENSNPNPEFQKAVDIYVLEGCDVRQHFSHAVCIAIGLSSPAKKNNKKMPRLQIWSCSQLCKTKY